MQCYEPGEVLILPVEGGAVNFRQQWRDDTPLEIRHSVEDVLRHYELPIGQMKNPFSALPFIARVPEGQEIQYALNYQRNVMVRASIPNFHVKPSSNGIQVNLEAINTMIASIGHFPMSPQCAKDVRIAIIDTGINPCDLPYPASIYKTQ